MRKDDDGWRGGEQIKLILWTIGGTTIILISFITLIVELIKIIN